MVKHKKVDRLFNEKFLLKGNTMNLKLIPSLVVLAAFNLVACSDNQEDRSKVPVVEVHNGYNATLAEGIQFAIKSDYPAFIKSVAGMSGYETIGRWTEGKYVDFVFAQNLPAKFTLDLEFAPAFGPDVGKVVKIEVGDWKNQFIASDLPKKVTFLVETSAPSDSIKFIVPFPVSPEEIGAGTDTRKVGIMFKRLSIISNESAKVAPAVISNVPAIVSLPVTAPVLSKVVTTKKPVIVKTVPTKKIAKKKKKVKLINKSPIVK
jgi:hypothetical protein